MTWAKNKPRRDSEALNRQGQAITSMYWSFIAPFMDESNWIPASIMLDYQQRKYAYYFLTSPDRYLTKNLLPITLRAGNGSLQPGELPKITRSGHSIRKSKSIVNVLPNKHP